MTTEDSKDTKQPRVDIIQTVQTPLGFFVLVVLVVEVILGVTANFSQGSDRTYLVIGMIGLIFLLVGLVAFLAYCRPEALQGIRPTMVEPALQWSTSIPAVERVNNPSILCASGPPFSGPPWEFERDLTVIQKIFPKRVAVERDITSERLRELLTSREFQIVHIVGYVDKASGDLIFGQHDRLPAEGFAKLVEVCKARLVVLATCDSIALAAYVLRTSNVVAAISVMQVTDCVAWESSFYKLISKGHPLSRASEIARAACNAPMVLLLKQDITFA